MTARGCDIDWTLSRNASGAFFECLFWPPNPNVRHERLYLRAAAVPSSEVGEARHYFEAEVLPALMTWIEAILSLPVDSTLRREQQHFVRSLRPGLASA